MTPTNDRTSADERQLVPPTHPAAGLIWVDRGRLSGAPCFDGTRVPIKNLWDYLEGGEPLSEFLEDFEGVTAEQARGVLRLALQALMEQLPRP
jgi:uncharacterized protein (DUF433 family)